MNKPKLMIKLLPHAEELGLPFYATEGSAGMDLKAANPEDEPVYILPMQRKLIPLGIQSSFDSSFEVQIRPRSGNALKKGLSIPNSPGTIDSDYSGEWCVILINLGDEPVKICRGDRIAQAVLCPVYKAEITKVDSVNITSRGSGGFGSTGWI